MQAAGRAAPPAVVSGQSGARPGRLLREALSGCMWGTDGRGEGGHGERREEVDGPGLVKAEDLGKVKTCVPGAIPGRAGPAAGCRG